MQRVAVRRIEQHGCLPLQLAQEKPPAQAEDQRERCVTRAEQEQIAASGGPPTNPRDPWQRKEQMRHRVALYERKGTDNPGCNEAQRAALEEQPGEKQVEEEMRGHGEIGKRHADKARRAERE